MNGITRKVPNRGNMETTHDGYMALKKDALFDKEIHKFNYNPDCGSFFKDHLNFTTIDQPQNNDNIYLQRHELFPGYTLNKPVSLLKYPNIERTFEGQVATNKRHYLS
jgi:hypothetical protein